MQTYQPPCGIVVDAAVRYDGPNASCATLGGSPTWGLGDKFHEFVAKQTAWIRKETLRPQTPYGIGPVVEVYVGKEDESARFLRIPTYGQTYGEDPILGEYKAFWICWSAGVKMLLVGGTSGTLDWRTTEEGVLPGDFVIPSTYLPKDNMPYGLPATPLEFCLGRQVAIMDDPFCGSFTASLFKEALATGVFRRIHVPIGSGVEHDAAIESEVCLNRWVGGNGFEGRGECRQLQVQGQLMGMPIITGDCISPVLARVCGMHLIYYHIPVNWGTGLFKEDPTKTLNTYYLEVLPEKAAMLEVHVLEKCVRDGEPKDCPCVSLLKQRPKPYELAFSPPVQGTRKGEK